MPAGFPIFALSATNGLIALAGIAVAVALGLWLAKLYHDLAEAREALKEEKARGEARQQKLDATNEAHLALQASSAKLKAQITTLEACATEGIWTYEVEVGSIYGSSRFYELLGLPPETPLTWASLFEELISPDDRELAEVHFHDFCEGLADPWEAEFGLTQSDREFRRLKSTGHVLERSEDGRPLRLGIASRDVGDTVKLREELTKLKGLYETATHSRNEFLANMSHEIRTPMNAIVGMAHLVMQTELSSRQREYVEKIRTSTHLLLNIINDVLDLSRIESGHLALELIPFNLQEVLRNMFDLMITSAEEKNLELIVDIPADVPLSLIGDPNRLGQILINLTSNAVKFTDKGEVMVRIEEIGGSLRTSDVMLKVTIEDTGIGMTQDQMDRIFKAFAQGDSSITRKFGGAGLGLVISRRLVEAMEGTIDVESTVGKGTRITFTIKLQRQEGSRPRRPDSSNLEGLRVLLVDDSVTAREIMAEGLRVMGFRVAEADSGENALRRLESAADDDPFDLILVDWKMPDMDGLATTRRIRQGNRTDGAPKVVMITSFGREELVEEGRKVGVDAFLTKPFSQSNLFDTVINLFGQSQRQSPSGKPPGIAGEAGTIPDQPLDEHLNPPPAAASIAGAHILLVEDNEINRAVAVEVLKRSGARVTTAENGQIALDKLASTPVPFDLVLMDLQMPVMDGFAATEAIRRDERFAEIPVVAMTAHAFSSERERCLACGMNEHTTKPINPEKLLGVLARFISTPAAPPSAPVPKVAPLNRGEMDGRPATTAGYELPDSLPGINVALGLENVGGAAELYGNLLKQYARAFDDAADTLDTLAGGGDVDEIRQHAHSVRGVAANLGATSLAEACKAIEVTLAEGGNNPFPIEQLLAEFRRQHERVISSIESLRPAAWVADAGTIPSALSTSENEIAEALDRLEALIASQDFEVDEQFSHVMAMAGDRVSPEVADAFSNHIADFAFDKAADLMPTIRSAVFGK